MSNTNSSTQKTANCQAVAKHYEKNKFEIQRIRKLKNILEGMQVRPETIIKYNCMFVRTVIIVLRFRNLLLLVFKTFTFEGNALILNIYYYGIYYMYIFNII